MNTPTSFNKSRRGLQKMTQAFRTGACFAWHASLGSAIFLKNQTVRLAKQCAHNGERFEAKTATELSERAKRARRSAANLSRRARHRVGRVESLIDAGVNESLHFVGAPSRRDLDELKHRARELSARIATLTEQEKQAMRAEQARQAASEAPQAGKPA